MAKKLRAKRWSIEVRDAELQRWLKRRAVDLDRTMIELLATILKEYRDRVNGGKRC